MKSKRLRRERREMRRINEGWCVCGTRLPSVCGGGDILQERMGSIKMSSGGGILAARGGNLGWSGLARREKGEEKKDKVRVRNAADKIFRGRSLTSCM